MTTVKILIIVLPYLMIGWVIAILSRVQYPTSGPADTIIWVLAWPVVIARNVIMRIDEAVSTGPTDHIASWIRHKLHERGKKNESR